MNEDQILMGKFQAGDPRCFEMLVLKYRVPAVAFARKLTLDVHAAEDIAQESFADLFVHKERYDARFSFKTYLFSIIKNKSLHYIRKNQRWVPGEVEIQSEASPESEVLKKSNIHLVRRMINGLKEDYRTAIYLVEYENFSYEEISKIMGRSLGQVKILVHRARKKLRAMLEREV